MEIQDKIGREQAKIFLGNFAGVHEWDPKKVEIFKKTEMYRFLDNSNPKIWWQRRRERTQETGKTILPLEIKLLLSSNIITIEEGDNLIHMIFSSEADFSVAELAIDKLRKKRKRRRHG